MCTASRRAVFSRCCRPAGLRQRLVTLVAYGQAAPAQCPTQPRPSAVPAAAACVRVRAPERCHQRSLAGMDQQHVAQGVVRGTHCHLMHWSAMDTGLTTLAS